MYELYGHKTVGDREVFSVSPIAKAKTVQNARVKAVEALLNGYKSVTVFGSKSEVPTGVVSWSYDGPIWMKNGTVKRIEKDGTLGRRV